MVRKRIANREPVFSPEIVSLKRIHSLPFPFENNNVLFFGYGRVALYEGLGVLGVKEGDNVLVPNYICNVVVAPMHRLNIKVKFYEIDSNLKPVWDSVESKIAKNTKALIIVNYFGFPNDLEKAKSFCAEHGIYLIEDNAHGFLSSDDKKPLGSFGDISIFSFRKILPMPNGAALVVNNNLFEGKLEGIEYLSNKNKTLLFFMRSFFNSLQDNFEIFRNKIDFETDRIKNISEEYNIEKYFIKFSQFSFFLLRHFDFDYIISQRRKAYNNLLNYFSKNYSKNLKIVFPELKDGVVPFVFPVLVNDKREFISRMCNYGVECFPWPFLPESSNEKYLSQWLVCIPVYREFNLNNFLKILDEY